MTARTSQPLANRMRPQGLDEFIGQAHLLDVGKPLRNAIEKGAVTSMVLWGPPGCGKTTLARLIANHTSRAFVPFSAVTEGVPRVREIIREAREQPDGHGTLLFCDEIHRFNKAQQDAFLPSVEEGLITLIGATTENPSFELNSALLSRLRVFVMEPLGETEIAEIVVRAWAQLRTDAPEEYPGDLEADAVTAIGRYAGGDARSALNATEAIWDHFAPAPPAQLDSGAIEAVLERRIPRYDKGGESHYNMISALHKAVRGSHVEGALYWFARMARGGEDMRYVARRVVRMAAEDIGLADPRALTLALAARDAYEFLGSPEGDLAIAEAIIYLASAAKSNRTYLAWNRALNAADTHPDAPVPLHLRNAPTGLMRDIGYGAGYRYDHDEGGHASGQTYLPDALTDAHWYEPTDQGFEKSIAQRLQWWKTHLGRKDE